MSCCALHNRTDSNGKAYSRDLLTAICDVLKFATQDYNRLNPVPVRTRFDDEATGESQEGPTQSIERYCCFVLVWFVQQ